MPTDIPFSDRFAKIFDEAASVADGVRQEFDSFVKARMEKLATEMNAVPREEFEAVRDMALAAREENRKLTVRLQGMQKRLRMLESRQMKRRMRHLCR